MVELFKKEGEVSRFYFHCTCPQTQEINFSFPLLREQTVQYSLPLHQTHFTRSSGRYGQEEAVVSCLVKDQRGLTIANDTRLIRKEESERLAPMQSWDQVGYFEFSFTIFQARMGNSRDGRDFHTAQPVLFLKYFFSVGVN